MKNIGGDYAIKITVVIHDHNENIYWKKLKCFLEYCDQKDFSSKIASFEISWFSPYEIAIEVCMNWLEILSFHILEKNL